MKKTLVSFSAIFASLILAPNVFAGSDLEVATDSGFSNQTINFSAGQTVYVRINKDSSGDGKKQLNLRDNNYNLIQSYTLNKSGSTFSASFSAPSNKGYYSLEAKIEGNGSDTTSVKTIKVGSPTSANVKVNINNKVTGQSNSNAQNSSPSPHISAVLGNNSESSPTPAVDNSDVQLDHNSENQNNKGKSFAQKLNEFVTKLLDVIWPF